MAYMIATMLMLASMGMLARGPGANTGNGTCDRIQDCSCDCTCDCTCDNICDGSGKSDAQYGNQGNYGNPRGPAPNSGDGIPDGSGMSPRP